jgi:hypothetical protein
MAREGKGREGKGREGKRRERKGGLYFSTSILSTLKSFWKPFTFMS